MKPSTLLRLVLLAGALALQTLAVVRAGEVSAILGGDRGYHNAMLAYTTQPLWTRTTAYGRFDLGLEVSSGKVAAPSWVSGSDAWHVGLTPLLRWWWTTDNGIELGTGMDYFSRTQIGRKDISTDFQFGDSIGVFHRFAAAPLTHAPWTLGLRFTHYSNAGIRNPNPGQNYLQLLLGFVID